MSDNQDLKSKILLMRQKNFGEVVNEPNEKNDNEKPVDAELNQDKSNIETNQNKDEVDQNKVQVDIQYDKNLDISELKENLNKVAETNEKAFDLLAKKFNESVEVILELTQRVEKLETVTKLQSMQESVNKNEVKPRQKGLKFFLFLLFVAGISYFFYKFDIDFSILKDISRDFLAILEK
jgi:hypothetical protein